MPTGVASLTLTAIAAFAVIAVTGILVCRMFRPRYRLRPTLLTPGETAFFRILSTALPRGYVVSLQVRLADLVTVERGLRRRLAFRDIAAKSVDFVVCDQALRPRLAIELNDRSHDAPQRRRRDRFLAQTCEQSGLPLVFIKAAARYDLADVARLLSIHGITSRR